MSRLPVNVERKIKTDIEKAKCPIHGKHPKVTFTQQGFNISCCCEEFRADTISKCREAIGKALQDAILHPFKKLR
ncbi:hypothetical protein [Bacteroides clarus]|uniref:hypothetical protein n=1 Tax=Bacteroides clarus TaxID=626929 RepID=UPI00248FD6A4|nr:hypothetical protein [Bacteroides clarus]